MRHNKASSDGVHQPMVDTIERRADSIGNCRFAQTRHKASHAGRLRQVRPPKQSIWPGSPTERRRQVNWVVAEEPIPLVRAAEH